MGVGGQMLGGDWPLKYLPETFDAADQISNTPNIKYPANQYQI